MTDCTLCELPVGDPPVADADVDGEFCCRGCLEIYRTLGDVDVSEARTRTREEATREVPEGAKTEYLAVDGMHCSTCELFLESTARKQDGVYDAEASYAAEAVKVVYDPEDADVDTVTDGLSRLGYRARTRDEDATDGPDMASRLLVGGFFGMMAMTWYILFLYPTYFGFDPIVTLGQFDSLYIYGQLAVVTTIILLYTGQPMLRGAYVSVRARRPNVDLLVSLAALAAYLYSTGRLLMGASDLYYDVTIVVVLAVTVGNYYESRIKRQTSGLLADLTELQVEEATRRNGDTVAVEDIEPGEELLVTPGERIPVDGTVSEGTAAVDEALVTGESLPETKRPGDEVRGGTVVTDAPVVITAGEAAESTLDRVVSLLWDIQATRPGAQRVADKLATVFVPLVLVIAAGITAVLLVMGSSPRVALLTGLTVLIVSCPCALGLATPLAVASGLQTAASKGIVVTTPALFEHGGDVDTLVFDKTGTLTDGEMAIKDVIPVDGKSTVGDELLYRAAAVEQFSTHPIADAITDVFTGQEGADDSVVQASRNESAFEPVTDGGVRHVESNVTESTALSPTSLSGDVESFEQFTRGVAATVDGEHVVVGHPALLRERGFTLDESLSADVREIRNRGDVPVAVGWNEQVRGLIAVGDTQRKEWGEIAESLGDGRRVVVLTGDDGPAADHLRDHPAIDEVYAGVPPDAKAETVRRLATTDTVAMVGDGSNDAPALAAADIGIAVEGGTKLATDAADAIVLDGDLTRLPSVFDVATGTSKRIRENLAWAFVYNGIAIPLALTGLLNPLFAALAMATSSVLVVANSAR